MGLIKFIKDIFSTDYTIDNSKVSNFSKEDIVRTLGINEKNIVITFNGHEHFGVDNATDFVDLKSKYNLPNEYFFHLGGDAPSKNTKFLLKYFSEHPNINIIIAGIRKLENSHLFLEYNKYPNIYFVPYISQRDLVGLYKNAKAFIFASLYEGFGIPLLEAMKCNCPIICSNASCLPEVAGNTALYFSPNNTNEFIKAIESVDNAKEYLLSTTSKQIGKFSWLETSDTIYKMYRSLNV